MSNSKIKKIKYLKDRALWIKHFLNVLIYLLKQSTHFLFRSLIFSRKLDYYCWCTAFINFLLLWWFFSHFRTLIIFVDVNWFFIYPYFNAIVVFFHVRPNLHSNFRRSATVTNNQVSLRKELF